MIQLEDTVMRRPDLLTSGMEDETVMFDLESGQYFGMDPVGSAIWERIAKPIKVVEMCRALQEEFDVDPATCQKDVLAFLNELFENQLVQQCV